jgi:hypothetical protein
MTLATGSKLGRMRLWGRSGQVGWGKCIAQPIRVSDVTWH